MKTTSEIAQEMRERVEYLRAEAEKHEQVAASMDAERESLEAALRQIDATGTHLEMDEPDEIQVDAPRKNGVGSLADAAKAAQREATRSRRGRPKGTGQRDKDVLDVLKFADRPMSVNEIAERIGIKPNYLYRVLPELERQGKVLKQEKQWVAL